VVTVAEDDADARRIDELTLLLRRELLETDVDSVERPSGGMAPEGSRGLDAATIGTLLVAVSSSALSVAQVVNTIRGWARRASGAGVQISVGGSTLRLVGPPTQEQQHLVNQFIRAALTEQAEHT
jgi:hypothetical protein